MYLWGLFSLINCCFSYFWDIERDWDIQWFTASTGVLSKAKPPSPVLHRADKLSVLSYRVSECAAWRLHHQ